MPINQENQLPLVSIIMGSQSDWSVMEAAAKKLADFRIPHESRIVSAHRTPERLASFAQNAKQRGIKIIIAGAGGAAHLPGMAAAFSHLPVIGVPVKGRVLEGQDSLLSIVQMPRGAPVATMAINGAENAAIFAAQMLAISDEQLDERVMQFFETQAQAVPEYPKDPAP